MKYRRWSPEAKSRIILEGLEKKALLSRLCHKYQISQSQFYNWFHEFQTKAYKVFETENLSKKEKELFEENKKLKFIIADLSIELKKSELGLKGKKKGHR